MIKREAHNIRKYKKLTIEITAHVECESQSDTSNNRGDWNHLNIFQTIREQLTVKTWHQGTIEHGHIVHCTYSLESTNVKVENIRHGK